MSSLDMEHPYDETAKNNEEGSSSLLIFTTLSSCSIRDHVKVQNSMIDTLLDCSENDLMYKGNLQKNVYIEDSNDKTISPWEIAIPNPKYVIAKKRKSSNIMHDAEELYLSNSVVTTETSIQSLEISFVDCPAWKLAVEPLTYRYMPATGRYRAYKLGQKLLTLSRQRGSNGSKLIHDKQKLKAGILKELPVEFQLFLEQEKQRISLNKQNEIKMNKDRKRKGHTMHLTDEEVHKKNLYNVSDKFSISQSLQNLSTTAPLPPISAQLKSADEEKHEYIADEPVQDTHANGNSKQLNAFENIENTKMWHMPHSLSSSNLVDMRQHSAPIEVLTHSEPVSRVPSRNTEGSKTSRNDQQLYKLKRLPTITDTSYHNEISSHTLKINDKKGVSKQPVQATSTNVLREPVRLYRQNNVEADNNGHSHPIARSPVLQGSGYRKPSKDSSQNYPYYKAISKPELSKDRIDTSDFPAKNLFITGPEELIPGFDHSHLQYIAAKYTKSQKVLDDYSNESLKNIITTKQFLHSKTKTGLNPYIKKSKPDNKYPKTLALTNEKSFNSVSSNKNGGLDKVEVMPDVFVRRAEKFVTSKRVI